MKQITNKEAHALAKKIGLPAGSLSYSQLYTYESCGVKYKYKYVDKKKVDYFSTNLFYGSVLHIGIEHFLKNKTMLLEDRNHLSTKEMKKFAKEYLIRSKHKPDNEEKLELKKNILALCELKNLWTEQVGINLNPTGVEEKIYIKVDGIPYVIKMDLINNNKISDFKLTSRMKSQKDADNSLQLSTYSLGTGLSDVSFIVFKKPNFNLKTKRWKPELPKEINSYRSEKDIEWCREVLHSIYKMIMSKNYMYADPESYVCTEDFCEYWKICRGKVAGVEKPLPDWIKI